MTFSTLPEDLAHEAHLRYMSDAVPGFMRTGTKNFTYYDLEGNRITDQKVLDRINSLGIPPAWEHVWVCPSPNGHLQATGRDEKGRKQYIYHPRWNEISNQTKFHKMLFFSEMLPQIRAKVREDMNLGGLQERKILATIVWLLDHTCIRIGNEEYAQENHHYGLTTMHNKHVDVHGQTVVFEFVGKSGKKHQVGVTHPKIAKTIQKLEDLPGYELFQFIDNDGKRSPIDSADVNEYLKFLTQEAVTAKDFRTWGGTVTSADSLVSIGEYNNKTELKKNVKQAVLKTAKKLGNTPTVCRSYYIHPTVINTYEQLVLIPHFNRHSKASRVKGLDRHEYATALLLKKYS